MPFVRIPSTITVHLGVPDDASAPNVVVPFADYIKNVASGEIYPTWPESALRANIYAQVTFALNRVYTEWYRARGYDFDITNSTRYDQQYTPNREVFENISQIVDEVYNDYVVREGTVQPIFTQYCNGTTATCNGLSQWGTVDLAEEGLLPYEILQYYYGPDIGIVFNAPTSTLYPSYPGNPLRLGSAGEEVRTIQRELNRIGLNYPAIRPELETNGIFDVNTETAVKTFQKIFNLTVDGIVGKATWYKIKSIFNAVKGLGELETEGLTIEEVDRLYPEFLRPGDISIYVQALQTYLRIIGLFDDEIPVVEINAVFDEQTEDAVRAFQRQQGLTVDGIVGRETLNALIKRYDRILANLPPEAQESADEIYPGRYLAPGETGENVRILQGFLSRAAQLHEYIPEVSVDGVYGERTAAAVRAVQEEFGIPVNGLVGPITWNTIVYLSKPQSVS